MKDILNKAQQVGKKALEVEKEIRDRIMEKHVVKKGETLSDIALKYYGHATEKYWKIIYTFNHSVIGDDPGKIRDGLELNIPKLPEKF